MARDGKQLRIAVAANFTEPVMKIGAAFERTSRHKLAVAFGATGQLYAQISQGAPFEILLAADKATPAKAIAEGHAVAGTAFTYALGRLVLFSRTGDLIQGEATLRNAGFAKIAIANPATAPYGAAAIETMKALGVYDALQPRIVQGNSIAQVFQFVDTGNAEAGFVALSQIALVEGGSRWIVPARWHAPIAQDVHCLVQCPAAPERFWVQHHNGIFVSSDEARTFTELKDVEPSVFGFPVRVHPKDPDTAWFVPEIKDEKRIPVGGKLVLSRTRDGGKTFETLSKGLPQTHAYDVVYRHALALDATGTRLAFGSTTGGLWVSEDQGDSWHEVSHTLPPVYAVRFA